MIDTFRIYNDLKESFGDEPAKKMTRVIGQIYEELSQSVRREDFNALKEVVEELAEAQKKTEARLDSLTAKVEELAEAQKRTEEELGKLIRAHKKTREMVGGLSHAVGYRLEDEAIWALPMLLKQDFGLEVKGRLSRGFIELSPKKFMEVNIWGEAEKDGKHYQILGEAKTQLKKRDIDKFLKDVDRIRDFLGRDIFPVLITYHTSPQVLNAAKEKGVNVYFSFELRPDLRSVS